MTDKAFKRLIRRHSFPDYTSTDCITATDDIWLEALDSLGSLTDEQRFKEINNCPFSKIIISASERELLANEDGKCYYYALEKYKNLVFLYIEEAHYDYGSITQDAFVFETTKLKLSPIGYARMNTETKELHFVLNASRECKDKDSDFAIDACKICLKRFDAIFFLFKQIKENKKRNLASKQSYEVKTVERKTKIVNKNVKTIIIHSCDDDKPELQNKKCADRCAIEREYSTVSWNTRGHYRTLKSGKSIWIEPHQNKRSDKLLSNRQIKKQSVYKLRKE